jgi:hypothetical protein
MAQSGQRGRPLGHQQQDKRAKSQGAQDSGAAEKGGKQPIDRGDKGGTADGAGG